MSRKRGCGGSPHKKALPLLDKASETFAQLYNVRVSFSGGAAPPTPLFCRNCKVSLNLVLRLRWVCYILPMPSVIQKANTSAAACHEVPSSCPESGCWTAHYADLCEGRCRVAATSVRWATGMSLIGTSAILQQGSGIRGQGSGAAWPPKAFHE